MSLIALMNNHAEEFLQDVKTFATDFIEYFIFYTNILYIDLSKYMETFSDKHYLAISSFLIIIYTGLSFVEHYNNLERMKNHEDQIQNLKKKNTTIEGTIDFLLENNANNELKIGKLTKQMKKLQKEVNEYA